MLKNCRVAETMSHSADDDLQKIIQVDNSAVSNNVVSGHSHPSPENTKILIDSNNQDKIDNHLQLLDSIIVSHDNNNQIPNQPAPTQSEMETKKRLEFIQRNKRNHYSMLGKQLMERLVDENEFLYQIMNVLKISQEMKQLSNNWKNSYHSLMNQEFNWNFNDLNNSNHLNNNNTNNMNNNITDINTNNNNNNTNDINNNHTFENLFETTTMDTPQHSKEPFLNIYIGISKLDYPCKKILTQTLFRNNLIGVNHPFIIIGCFKIEWNDSSLVKIKYDLFKARNAMMVYKFHVIRGTLQVQQALKTIARVCTFWNAYKKFSQLCCNCHHFICYLLRELNIESPFDRNVNDEHHFNSDNSDIQTEEKEEQQKIPIKHSSLLYMLSKLRLAQEERYILWNKCSELEKSQDKPNKYLQHDLMECPDLWLHHGIQWNEKEFIVNGGEKQLVAFRHFLIEHFQQQVEQRQVKETNHDAMNHFKDERKQSSSSPRMNNSFQKMYQEAFTCIDSYLNGYRLRNQTVRMLDYSQLSPLLVNSINIGTWPFSSSSSIHNLELEYPLLNAYWESSMFEVENELNEIP